MSKSVDQLLTTYERGACTRRQLLSALAAIGIGGTALSAGQQSRPGSSVARINHVNLRVSDLARSVKFYENLVGPGFRQFPTSSTLSQEEPLWGKGSSRLRHET